MFKALRQWKHGTKLSNGTFFKFYIWDKVVIKPERKVRRWLRR